MKNETLVNIVMVTLVGLVVLGSGGMVYKNLLDKEASEKAEAAKTGLPPPVTEYIVRPATDSATMQTEGYIMYNGKMYETKGQYVMLMKNNVLLVNETQILTSGKITRKDKSQLTLKENYMINLNGEVIKNTRDISNVIITPTVITPTIVKPSLRPTKS